MWRSRRKKTCSDWGGCRAVMARGMLGGLFVLPECDREGPSVTKTRL